jgi:hypothetical protein
MNATNPAGSDTSTLMRSEEDLVLQRLKYFRRLTARRTIRNALRWAVFGFSFLLTRRFPTLGSPAAAVLAVTFDSGDNSDERATHFNCSIVCQLGVRGFSGWEVRPGRRCYFHLVKFSSEATTQVAWRSLASNAEWKAVKDAVANVDSVFGFQDRALYRNSMLSYASGLEPDATLNCWRTGVSLR